MLFADLGVQCLYHLETSGPNVGKIHRLGAVGDDFSIPVSSSAEDNALPSELCVAP